MNILTLTDFDNGKFSIATNPEQSIDLQSQIDFVERTYLVELFGVELYDLFILDLVNPSLTPRFQFIFDAFNYQSSEKPLLVHSEGLKQMLKAFVYFLYVRDTTTSQTTVGIKRTKSDNSENVSAIHHGITLKYNDGIKNYDAIQYYMIDNEDVYPEFLGIHKCFSHPF